MADILESGLIYAFVILAFSFFIILPGIRGKEVNSFDKPCLVPEAFRLEARRKALPDYERASFVLYCSRKYARFIDLKNNVFKYKTIC